MISPGVTTKKYSVQSTLIENHRESLNGLSMTLLCQREINFMQKLLDEHAPYLRQPEDKQQIERFQNLIIYYGSEVIPNLQEKLRNHENHMADVLKATDETDNTYYQTHNKLMSELQSFDKHFHQFKHELFQFIEKAL